MRSLLDRVTAKVVLPLTREWIEMGSAVSRPIIIAVLPLTREWIEIFGASLLISGEWEFSLLRGSGLK